MSAFDPKSRAEAERRTYGRELGRGSPFNPKRCAATVNVSGTTRYSVFAQCSKKPGFGPDGIFCRVHDPVSIADRARKQQERFDAKSRARERPFRERDQAVKLLRHIVASAGLKQRAAIDVADVWLKKIKRKSP